MFQQRINAMRRFLRIPAPTALGHPARRIYLVACLCLIGLWPLTSAAMTGDKEQPITIEADRVDIDDKKGISIYQGKVRVTQGSMVMTADTVTTYAVGDKQARQRELDKIIAVGAPAHFRQLLDTKDAKTGKNEEMRGQALRIDYFAREERLVLQGGSHIWKEGDEFSGNVIEYDVAQETVKAAMGNVGGQAGEGPQERVHAVIQPRRKKDAKTP